MTNYKQKYLKYKKKYLQLKGGAPRIFRVIKNNGSDGTTRYSNQCMWLSLRDYLNNVVQLNINLDTIKAQASKNGVLSINDNFSIFNENYHRSSLNNFLNMYGLRMVVYEIQYRGNIMFLDDEAPSFFGNVDSPNIVYVAHTDNHFELVTHIGDRQLYNLKPGTVTSEYAPDIELIYGVKVPDKSKRDRIIVLTFEKQDLSRDIKENFKIKQQYKDIIKGLYKEHEETNNMIFDYYNTTIRMSEEDKLNIKAFYDRLDKLNNEIKKYSEYLIGLANIIERNEDRLENLENQIYKLLK
jgi:hypothetical protein